MLWIRRNAPPRVPPRVKIEEYADVVELVDSLDLGSNARACRFESCHPHQKKRGFAPLFLVRMVDSKRAAERKRSKKVSGGHFFSPGKSPWMEGGRRYAC